MKKLLLNTLMAKTVIYDINHLHRYAFKFTFDDLQDWGRLGDVKELHMNWHIPSPEELETANMVLEKYLQREMDKLTDCMDGKQLTRYVKGWKNDYVGKHFNK